MSDFPVYQNSAGPITNPVILSVFDSVSDNCPLVWSSTFLIKDVLSTLDQVHELVRLGLDPVAEREVTHFFVTDDIGALIPFVELMESMGFVQKGQILTFGDPQEQVLCFALSASHNLQLPTIAEFVNLLFHLAAENGVMYAEWEAGLHLVSQSVLLQQIYAGIPYLADHPGVRQSSKPNRGTAMPKKGKNARFRCAFATLDAMAAAEAELRSHHCDVISHYVAMSGFDGNWSHPYLFKVVARDSQAPSAQVIMDMIAKHGGKLL